MFFTGFVIVSFELSQAKQLFSFCVNKINAFIDSFPNQTFSKIQKKSFSSTTKQSNACEDI